MLSFIELLVGFADLLSNLKVLVCLAVAVGIAALAFWLLPEGTTRLVALVLIVAAGFGIGAILQLRTTDKSESP